MRIFAVSLLILDVLVFLVGVLTAPTITKVHECMLKAEESFFSDFSRQAAASQDKRLSCEISKKNIVELQSCIEAELRADLLTGSILRVMSVFRPEFRSGHFTNIHNKGCAEFPETML